ncbi:MAG: glycosyltransferase [Kiritimatiellae bacterium]|nr:glycosyltransferase [Kiritimatiellia bacterium]
MHPQYEAFSDKRVVLAHDWLTGMRGGEKVLSLICDQFPQAKLYTLIHKQGAVDETIARHIVATSLLQYLPGVSRWYRYALPLFPYAIEHMRPAQADLIISTSHCVAKGIPTQPPAKHLCYCFTPMRYAWVFYEEYFGKNPAKKWLLNIILKHLRNWDKTTAEKVTRFVAISHHIRKRIEKYYGREADVVYPPVDVDRLSITGKPPERFDLIVSALLPYKRIDLAVKAYNQTKFPLKIVGTGTEYRALSSMAEHNIQFLGWQSDDAIRELYQQCRCLIFPGEEDFGIVPVEAQACGRPVVAYAKGGALETIVDRQTGIFFHDQTPEALNEAVQQCATMHWDQETIRKNAERFSNREFLTGLAGAIHQTLDMQ